MSTVTHIPTRELQPNDTLLDGASMLSVDRIEPDSCSDDAFWLYMTCVSGNFDQYEHPVRASGGLEWRVLNAEAR